MYLQNLLSFLKSISLVVDLVSVTLSILDKTLTVRNKWYEEFYKNDDEKQQWRKKDGLRNRLFGIHLM